MLDDFLDIVNQVLGFLDGANAQDFPGSCFTAIAAAFATQGYWIHSDMLYLVGGTSFEHFAILIYLCAAIGGLAGMALGAPPKLYLWFFIGPAVYHFLIGATVDVKGVAWKVAGRVQDMNYVSRLASTGVRSDRVQKRIDFGYHDGEITIGLEDVYQVAWFFAELDGVVSDTIQTMTDWLGVYSVSTNDADLKEKKWYLLSNLKWGFLDTITSARINTPGLRHALVFFANKECGRTLNKLIDPALLGRANSAESALIPPRLFYAPEAAPGAGGTPAATSLYDNVKASLNAHSIAVPSNFKALFTTSVDAGLRKALEGGSYQWSDPGGAPSGTTITTSAQLFAGDEISCSKYLDLLIHGLRWESGNIFTNLVGKLPNLTAQTPGAASPTPGAPTLSVDQDSKLLVSSMLHGWDLRKKDPFNATETGTALTADEQQQYLVNMIFLHMLKNELMIAGPGLNFNPARMASDKASQKFVEAYQATVGSKNKYGEVYTWAMMMPYLQGTVLYLLAFAYPFVCMFILIPGWHKIIFTWANFWIWVKVWDLGFAIVMLLERSVWATLGNTVKASKLNPFIVQMSEWGTYKFAAVTGAGAAGGASYSPYAVTLFDGAAGAAADANTSITNSLKMIERGISLFSSLDFDLQNSYYIYIMAALYFAVPAITGQIVLGAKAAVAGLVTSAFTSMAQETGAKAGAGFLGELQKRVDASAQSAYQAMTADALGRPTLDKNGNPTQPSLLAKALGAQNRGQAAALDSNVLGQFKQGVGAQAGLMNTMFQRRLSDAKFGSDNTLIAARNPLAFTGIGLTEAAGVTDFFSVLGGLKAEGGPASRAAIPGVGGPGMTPGFNPGQMSGAPLGMAGVRAGLSAALSGGVGDTNGAALNMGSGAGGGGAGLSPEQAAIMQRALQASGGGRAGLSGNPFGTVGGILLGGVHSFAEMVGNSQQYALQRQQSNVGALFQAQQSGLAVQEFGYKAEADRLNSEGQRLNMYAQGAAMENAFMERSQWAINSAGTLAAMGIQGPTVGELSTDSMYLAKAGYAGKDAYEAANFFADGGAYQTSAQGAYQELKGNFDFGKMYGYYSGNIKADGPVGEMREGFGRFRDALDRNDIKLGNIGNLFSAVPRIVGSDVYGAARIDRDTGKVIYGDELASGRNIPAPQPSGSGIGTPAGQLGSTMPGPIPQSRTSPFQPKP